MAHTHEVVYQLVHWFDDQVFEQCPTWEGCLAAGIFSRCQLEAFFGPEGNQHGETEGAGGSGRYAQCVQTGIGRRIIAKMLEGTETDDAIRTALENFPMTERRHLDKGQKIALALELEPLFAEENAKRRAQAAGQPRGVKQAVVENVPQQKSRDQAATAVGISGKLVSAAKAIKEAEKMLRETKIVYEFNALFKRSKGLPTLLQESQCLDQDNVISWRDNEYEKAKEAIEPGGSGLGRGFLQHFLPGN